MRPSRERAHLTTVHHEICTALTVLLSNVELVRHRLREPTPSDGSVSIRAHLDEMDVAIDRLRGTARDIRRWHDEADPDAAARAEALGGRQEERL